MHEIKFPRRNPKRLSLIFALLHDGVVDISMRLIILETPNKFLFENQENNFHKNEKKVFINESQERYFSLWTVNKPQLYT